jgi:hypothetical protein
MASQPRTITIRDRRGSRPWRETEPVIVGKFKDTGDKFKHKVVPPEKFATAGDTLVFKYYGCDKLNITGDIFVEPIDYSTAGEVHATLKGDLDRGIYHYTATCDGKIEAQGGSPPSVIIDP